MVDFIGSLRGGGSHGFIWLQWELTVLPNLVNILPGDDLVPYILDGVLTAYH